MRSLKSIFNMHNVINGCIKFASAMVGIVTYKELSEHEVPEVVAITGAGAAAVASDVAIASAVNVVANKVNHLNEEYYEDDFEDEYDDSDDSVDDELNTSEDIEIKDTVGEEIGEDITEEDVAAQAVPSEPDPDFMNPPESENVPDEPATEDYYEDDVNVPSPTESMSEKIEKAMRKKKN